MDCCHKLGGSVVLDKEERRTSTASAPCLAAGKFVASVERGCSRSIVNTNTCTLSLVKIY